MEIVERVQSLLALQLQIYGFFPQVLQTALDLCVDRKIPIYDAYLVALAKPERLTLVTADDKLWHKFYMDQSVMALGQFQPKTGESKNN